MVMKTTPAAFIYGEAVKEVAAESKSASAFFMKWAMSRPAKVILLSARATRQF